MRNMIGKLILMSTVAVNTFAAHAITAEKRFEVPFSFTVRGQIWPAGTYLMQHNGAADGVLLQSKQSNNSLAVMLGPGDPAPTDTRVMLTFAEDKQSHTLKSIQYGSKVAAVDQKQNKQIERLPVRIVPGQ